MSRDLQSIGLVSEVDEGGEVRQEFLETDCHVLLQGLALIGREVEHIGTELLLAHHKGQHILQARGVHLRHFHLHFLLVTQCATHLALVTRVGLGVHFRVRVVVRTVTRVNQRYVQVLSTYNEPTLMSSSERSSPLFESLVAVADWPVKRAVTSAE